MVGVLIMLSILKNLAEQFYNAGLYDKAIIRSFVACGALTAEDYQEITHDAYVQTNNQ